MSRIAFILLLFVPCLAGQLTARLANGTHMAGRLEIFHNGTWTTVCDDSFDNKDAMVACRMMGFDGIEATVVPSRMYGEGQGDILLSEVDCDGTETNLAQCRHLPYYHNDCNHTKDVGIICKLDTDHLLLTGTIRTRPEMGQLKVLLGKEWTTTCVGKVSSEAAKVLCRDLGFRSKASAAIAGSSFGPVQGPFVNVDLVCSGGEKSILGCFHTIYGFSDSCSTEGFGVVCSDSIFDLFIVLETNTRITEYPLMVGSNVTFKCVSLHQDPSHHDYTWPETAGGRPDGEYLIFDNLSREHNGSQVRCMARYNLSSNELIETTSDILELKVFSAEHLKVYMEKDHSNSSLSWNGTEQQATSNNDLTLGSTSSKWTSPTSVTDDPRVEQLTARLVNGTTNSGRLEIFYNGEWSTVCDDSFGYKEARVACRMLGFNSSEARAVSSMYGRGSGRIILDELKCRGTEISLSQCNHSAFYSHDCGHSEDVGVICIDAGQLIARLVNGTASSGRLEIFHNGEWSTVCDDGFENKEARVACRMLGFNSSGATAALSSFYGAGSGKILLDDMECKGTETSFSECTHKTFYSHDCSHSEDVGVVCKHDRQLVARLANGTSTAGRLEILYNGEWNTVCDDSFGNEESKVACRMLGFNSSGAVAVSSSVYGEGSGRIILDGVKCQGTETSLEDCTLNAFYSHNCGHSEDVGVVCKDETPSKIEPTAATTTSTKTKWELPGLTKPDTSMIGNSSSSSPPPPTTTKMTTTTTTTEKVTTVITTTTSLNSNATKITTSTTTTSSTTTTVTSTP